MLRRLLGSFFRNILLFLLEVAVVLFFAVFQLLRVVIGWVKNPRSISLPRPRRLGLTGRKVWLVAGGILVLVSAAGLLYWYTPASKVPAPRYFASELLIPAESAKYISNDSLFRANLVEMGERLDIHPSWILAVMFHESRLNPAARNFRGSGATGLIQFMGPALKDINKRLGTKYYLSHIKAMDAVTQLHLVEEYYEMVQERYGAIGNFTDAYLAVLYPKAIGQSPDHVLFSRPSRSYVQNAGLDINRDGRITVADISGRLYRMFPDLASASAILTSK